VRWRQAGRLRDYLGHRFGPRAQRLHRGHQGAYADQLVREWGNLPRDSVGRRPAGHRHVRRPLGLYRGGPDRLRRAGERPRLLRAGGRRDRLRGRQLHQPASGSQRRDLPGRRWHQLRRHHVGDIIMLSNYLNLSIPLLGSLQWDNDTVAAGIGTYTTRALESFQGFALAPSVNNCSVTPFLQFPPPVDPAVGLVTFLDAGASLSMQGPNGTATVAKGVNGGYGSLVGGETINDLITGCPATSTNQCAPFFLSPAFAIS